MTSTGGSPSAHRARLGHGPLFRALPLPGPLPFPPRPRFADQRAERDLPVIPPRYVCRTSTVTPRHTGMNHMRIALLPIWLPTALAAQTLVSTTPQGRTGILEEFTAINCGICPQAHAIAADLIAMHPMDLVVVNVHGGGLADPGSGQPDFRTSFGTAIWSQFGVNAQPLGLVNRRPHNGNTVLSRTVWGAATTNVLALPSPVNVGLDAQFDDVTRELTVQVETYYTDDGSGANDQLHVLLTEDDVTGYQQDYMNGAHPAYSHQHVLRSYLSPLWGDELVDQDAGTLHQDTYTFVVPLEWDIANCNVVAFVGEYQGEVYQAIELDASDFSTGVNDAAAPLPVPTVFPNPASDVVVIGTVRTTPTTPVILDAAGRIIQVPSIFADGRFILDVSSIREGLYIAEFADAAPVRFVVAR
jgi:Outer membrane protein Omp28